MSVCQGRRKIILDTLDVEVSAFQFCMLSWAVVNQPGASNSTDLQSVLQRQLLGLEGAGREEEQHWTCQRATLSKSLRLPEPPLFHDHL